MYIYILYSNYTYVDIHIHIQDRLDLVGLFICRWRKN